MSNTDQAVVLTRRLPVELHRLHWLSHDGASVGAGHRPTPRRVASTALAEPRWEPQIRRERLKS